MDGYSITTSTNKNNLNLPASANADATSFYKQSTKTGIRQFISNIWLLQPTGIGQNIGLPGCNILQQKSHKWLHVSKAGEEFYDKSQRW